MVWRPQRVRQGVVRNGGRGMFGWRLAGGNRADRMSTIYPVHVATFGVLRDTPAVCRAPITEMHRLHDRYTATPIENGRSYTDHRCSRDHH